MSTARADEHAAVRRALALVLVGKVDRRVLPAVHLAASLPEFDVRALHVSVDPDQSRLVAHDWMALDLSWMPLNIEEPDGDSLISTIRTIVRREVDDRRRVFVIVPEIDLDRWWQVLLHPSTGRRIARDLRSIRGVSTIVVPYPVDPAPRSGARL